MDMQIIAIYFFAKDWLPDRLAAEHNLFRQGREQVGLNIKP
jgi:hypothetical protein